MDEDEKVIIILQDLPDVYFQNGEFPNFRRGDLVRARVEDNGYRLTARIDYG